MEFSIQQIYNDMRVELRTHQTALIKALILPAAIMICLDFWVLSTSEPSSLSLIVYSLLSGLLYSLFAVNCHRIILLGENRIPNQWGMYFSKELFRYWFKAIIIGLWTFLAVLPLIALMFGLLFLTSSANPENTNEINSFMTLSFLPVSLLMIYLMSRMSLALPAAAIDQPVPIGEAWKWSSSNGWKLTIAISWPLLITYPIGFLSEWLNSLPLSAFVSILTYFLVAMTVSLLSCAYRIISPKEDAEEGALPA